MNGRDAYRMAMHDGQKKDKRTDKSGDDNRIARSKNAQADDSYNSTNQAEHALAIAIDNKNTILKLQKQLERLIKTSDVKGFLEDISPETVVQLALLAHNADTSEKVRLAAMQDILDRAGFNKVTKHAIARIDASESKEAIIASIKGAKKELKGVGIEITDDDEDIDEGSPETLEG